MARSHQAHRPPGRGVQVSHSRNVADFRDRMRQIFDAVPRVKATLDRNINVSSRDVDDPVAAAEEATARKKHLLECHARNFVIDHLLSALNWQIYPELEVGPYLAANVVIEQH